MDGTRSKAGTCDHVTLEVNVLVLHAKDAGRLLGYVIRTVEV